jgi:hypothetical protein
MFAKQIIVTRLRKTVIAFLIAKHLSGAVHLGRVDTLLRYHVVLFLEAEASDSRAKNIECVIAFGYFQSHELSV